MRLSALVCIVTIAASLSLIAQNPAPQPVPPQSARQALIEMFLGKGADDFTKHLPDDARKTLVHKGEGPEASIVLKVSAVAHEISGPGQHVEVFDTGPNILVSELNEHERIEVAVEHDSLLGEEDEIELSIHYYKDGQPQSLPVVPRLIFTLKQEKEIWRVTELTAAAHVPLTDPDYLAGLRKEQDEANESAAQARVSMIAQAETRFATAHPDRGFSCHLKDLFPGSEDADEEGTVASSVADQESNGYRFALAGCSGTPAGKYRLTATPVDSSAEIKAFCVDQSGKMKSIAAEKSSSCLSRGDFLNAVVPVVQTE